MPHNPGDPSAITPAVREAPPGPDCLSLDDALALCSDDPAPAATDLQRHIESCDACRMLVAEAARAMVDVGSSRTRKLLTLSEGEQVGGRYRIVRFLARGGMGEVYEAFDDVLQERVALKTIVSGALDDDRAIARLAMEVRLARRVTHPNVCRLLEFGFHAPATWQGARLPFLTMELLDGETLSGRLARVGPLSAAEALAVTRQMVAGLAAIHAAEIVHRDFKSDNVFLTRSPTGAERVVVMDFGLAHAPVGSALRPLTSGSLLAGTADYVAPEQLSGGPVTRAADIYALGVVLFEMLTGRRPFSGESPFITAINRLRLRPPVPSAVKPGIPAVWDRAVLSCLERQPDARFGRVEDLLTALDTGRDAPAARRRARLRWRLAALAGMTLALLTAASFMVRRWRPGAPVAPGALARRQPDLPGPVPVLTKPALLGKRWPLREIPVCVRGPQQSPERIAEIFDVRTTLDFSWSTLGDFWFGGWGPCPERPTGTMVVVLGEGTDERADLGYRPDGPTRVHIGLDQPGRYERVVKVFGRALGFGMRGSRHPSPEEVVLVQSVYGRKPPGSLVGSWNHCVSTGTDDPRARYTRCTGSAEASWRRHSPTRQLRSADPTPRCLGLDRPGGDQPVTTSACDRGARDVVSFRGIHWRVKGGRCLAAEAAKEHAQIQLKNCDVSPLQRWDFFEGDDRIRLSGSHLCVTAPPDAVTLGSGTRVYLRRCGRRSAGQQAFHFLPRGLIKLQPSVDLCLAVFGYSSASELGIGTWCERDSFFEEGIFHLQGQVRLGGGCLTVRGSPDDHTPLWTQPCVGGWNHQSWQYHW